MILDRILGKLGYEKHEDYEEALKNGERWFSAYDRKAKECNTAFEYCEKLKKDIGALKKEYRLLEEENRILKSRYSDEIQKRFELVEILAKSEIVIKNPEIKQEG